MRKTISMDKGWFFHLGDVAIDEAPDKCFAYRTAHTPRVLWGPASPGYDCRAEHWGNNGRPTTERWYPVDLPHDYLIEQEPKPENNASLGYFKYENAWYAKYFRVDPADENARITLLFDGVAAEADVYLNGTKLFHNSCAYTPFEVDITDFVFFDKDNKLAVYVQSGPFHQSWWYEGAGIYRHVWMRVTDTVAVDLWGVFAAPQKKTETLWNTEISTNLRNDGFSPRTVSLRSTVYDGEREVASVLTGDIPVPRKGKVSVMQSVEVENPALWELDAPHLYTVHTAVIEDGKAIDETDTTFGFRTLEYKPTGLYLNGKKIKINGVCSHQDFGLTGRAMPDNICRHKARLIKEMGANAYRTSHYPHTEAQMDAFDREGIMVMDETRFFESTRDGIEQLQTLIRRDRNHPCVIMWSMGNEEEYFTFPQGRKIFQTMYAAVKELDTTRPVTAAQSHDPFATQIFDICDIIGVNYNIEHMEKLHELYPDKCIYSSENCATYSARAGVVATRKGYLPDIYDQDTNLWFRGRQNSAKVISGIDWIAGGFQWIAIDHRGECNWPRLSSFSGAIDLYYQKKDAFYLNQSFWKSEPMLHLFPHMNLSGHEGEIISFWVYTNCDEVELYLDGKSLGRKTCERFSHCEWQVEYRAGSMRAVGYIDGKKVAEDAHETTKKAARLKLRLENADDIRANGQDVALFTCYCEDEDGRFVPDAEPTVHFECNYIGTLVGTGAVATDHTPPACPDRRLFAGLCSVAVKLTETEGKLTLYATADGLAPARLSVEVKK